MIAYVLSRWVQPSQTFVTNEVAELRRQGAEVLVVSIEHGQQPAPDDAVFVADLPHGVRTLAVRPPLAALAAGPGATCASCSPCAPLASEMGTGRDHVPWKRLPLVAADAAASEVPTALHAHFAWSGAAAALLLSRLTGLPWSMTLHANDIFSQQRNLELKLRQADRARDGVRLQPALDAGAPRADAAGRPGGLRRASCRRSRWPVLAEADVVAVGRLVEKKGFDTLLRAAAVLRRTRPGLRIDVVGEGRERERLEAMVQELGLGDHVRLLGPRSHEESLARMAGARVFCLPARVAADGDRDSMPVVIKEAMARRVPVVASDQVAIPEMLGDGCGLMVPPDDPQALADALGHVLDRPEESAARAAAARRAGAGALLPDRGDRPSAPPPRAGQVRRIQRPPGR